MTSPSLPHCLQTSSFDLMGEDPCMHDNIRRHKLLGAIGLEFPPKIFLFSFYKSSQQNLLLFSHVSIQYSISETVACLPANLEHSGCVGIVKDDTDFQRDKKQKDIAKLLGKSVKMFIDDVYCGGRHQSVGDFRTIEAKRAMPHPLQLYLLNNLKLDTPSANQRKLCFLMLPFPGTF